MSELSLNIRLLLLSLIFVFAPAAALSAAEPSDDDLIGTAVAETCFDCHSGDDPEAKLNLEKLDWSPDSPANRNAWIKVYDRIAKNEMPPDADSLPASRRGELLRVLSRELHAADHRQVRAEGRGTMRRLNRREFEASLRDLFGLPNLDIRDILPEDSEAHHTNKAATALDITRVQLDAFLDAADAALRAAIAGGVEPRPAKRYHALATKMFPKAVDHAGRESSFYAKHSKMVPLSGRDLARIRRQDNHDEEMEFALFRSANWPYYGYPEEFLAHESGDYRVRFFARSVRQMRDFRLVPSPDPLAMTFRARQPSAADVSGDVRATGGIIDVQPEGEVYETTVQLRRGETIEYSLLGLPVPFPITSHGGPLYYDFPPLPEGGHRGIAFRWIEIVGPIDPQPWPPASHRVLFGDLPLRAIETSFLPIEVVSQQPREDASRLLRRFADQAANKQIPQEALQPYEQLIFDQLDSGATFAESMLAGYKAFLCSGHFLFLREPRDPADHHAVAARLSHFLWNSRPDAILREQAAAGRLRRADVLGQETDRLIDDPRFERFIENFTDYWLELRQLGRDAPDIRLYPEYRGDDYLIESMGWETRGFVKRLIRDNLPARTLIESDFVMANDRLARHYELPNVQGSYVRPVPAPEWSQRGGILTQAAVLKVTANGTTTSPVTRGAWVMDRIFGDPPPPPPPNVPAVEPDIRGATTVREILEAHAADEACASCHRRFDPVGLALESFDIMGAWRDRYRSLEKGDEITGIDRAGHRYSYRVAHAVDASGQLRDGRRFTDVSELRSLLAGESRQLARNLLQRLIVYATGTPPRFSDRREIEAILDGCSTDGYRLRDLVHGLVKSRIFIGEVGLEDGEPADENREIKRSTTAVSLDENR